MSAALRRLADALYLVARFNPHLDDSDVVPVMLEMRAVRAGAENAQESLESRLLAHRDEHWEKGTTGYQKLTDAAELLE